MVTSFDVARSAQRVHRRPDVHALTATVRVLPLLVIGLLVADYVVAALRPATTGQVWLWTTVSMAFPIWFVGGAMLVAVTGTVLLGVTTTIRPVVIDGLIVIEMTLYYFGTKVWPPTGDQIGWWENAATRTVALSEPLADIIHKIPYWLTGSLESVRYVSPVFGAGTIVIYLLLARRLSRAVGCPTWVFRAFVIASPLPFWYVTGYVENTFLALPFMLLGIERTIAYFESTRRYELAGAAVAFAIGGLVHMGFALMCFAFAAAILLRPEIPRRRRIIDVAMSAALTLAMVLSVLGLIRLLPVDLVRGNTGGGYDGNLFVPLTLTPGDLMARFTFFSHAHLIEAANIVVHAAPALVLALPVTAVLALRRNRLMYAVSGPAGLPRDVLTVLGCTALVYVAFISIWGFDLGPVGDLDLMLVMGAGLGLYVLVLLVRLLHTRLAVLAVLLMLSGATQIAFYSMKVANAWVQ